MTLLSCYLEHLYQSLAYYCAVRPSPPTLTNLEGLLAPTLDAVDKAAQKVRFGPDRASLANQRT